MMTCESIRKASAMTGTSSRMLVEIMVASGGNVEDISLCLMRHQRNARNPQPMDELLMELKEHLRMMPSQSVSAKCMEMFGRRGHYMARWVMSNDGSVYMEDGK